MTATETSARVKPVGVIAGNGTTLQEMREMDKNYTQDWIRLLREGRGLKATDEKRKQLNVAIAVIATDGCENVYAPAISHQMQKAARMIMRFADQQEKEPLELLINVCDGYEGYDVYPESLLIATKYIEV